MRGVLRTVIPPWQSFFLSFLEQTSSILLSRRESTSFIALMLGLRQNEAFSRSRDAAIRVYDEAGNVNETHEHTGEFKEW
jgi:hypothetical protein